MGLASRTQITVNEDGTTEVTPADRFRVARTPYGYLVVDTDQGGTEAVPDGFVVWSSGAASSKDAIDELRALKAAAQAVAAEHNAAHPPLTQE